MKNAPRLRRDSRRQSGFSLIEVMVTVAIVAFGLMGLIALMLKGLQANAESTLRSIAINQAYDMADRMRANFTGIAAGSYTDVVPPGSTSTCPIDTAAGENVAAPTTSGLTACSGSDVATKDKCAWHKANALLLPSGAGAICKEVDENWYTINMSWDDDKSGAPNKTFVLRLEP